MLDDAKFLKIHKNTKTDYVNFCKICPNMSLLAHLGKNLHNLHLTDIAEFSFDRTDLSRKGRIVAEDRCIDGGGNMSLFSSVVSVDSGTMSGDVLASGPS